MTIDCNLLLPSRSNLKYKIDPPKAAPAAIMQGTSFDQHVNSIKSRPCTKLLTFLHVFNKSACKLNSNTLSLFLPCPSVKNTLRVFVLHVHKLSWAKKERSPRSKMAKNSQGSGNQWLAHCYTMGIDWQNGSIQKTYEAMAWNPKCSHLPPDHPFCIPTDRQIAAVKGST